MSTLLVAGFVYSLSAITLHAQVTYQTHPPISTPAPEGSFSVSSPSACTLPDGGFVPVNTVLKTDVSNTAAPITGPNACDIYVNGTYQGTFNRYLNYHTARRNDTLASHTFYAPYHVYSYDTQPYGFTWLLNATGAVAFDFQAHAFPTNCNIPTASASSRKTVNIVACKPFWLYGFNPPLPMYLPVTTVSLYIPSAMWSTLVGPSNDKAAVLAVADWNAALAPTGLTIAITSTPCGSGPDCISVTTATTASLGTSCARFTPGGLSMSIPGLISAASTMELGEDYWMAATQARLRRTIAHELAHGLSLDHTQSCSTADNLMSSPTVGPGKQFATVFDACTQDTGMAIAPTTTDILPTVASTYGNMVRALCGF